MSKKTIRPPEKQNNTFVKWLKLSKRKVCVLIMLVIFVTAIVLGSILLTKKVLITANTPVIKIKSNESNDNKTNNSTKDISQNETYKNKVKFNLDKNQLAQCIIYYANDYYFDNQLFKKTVIKQSITKRLINYEDNYLSFVFDKRFIHNSFSKKISFAYYLKDRTFIYGFTVSI